LNDPKNDINVRPLGRFSFFSRASLGEKQIIRKSWGNKKKAAFGSLYVLVITGGGGQNRTADTGIFSSYLWKNWDMWG
jgi:hypothetical protein